MNYVKLLTDLSKEIARKLPPPYRVDFRSITSPEDILVSLKIHRLDGIRVYEARGKHDDPKSHLAAENQCCAEILSRLAIDGAFSKRDPALQDIHGNAFVKPNPQHNDTASPQNPD
jgi:hypothetical protein